MKLTTCNYISYNLNTLKACSKMFHMHKRKYGKNDIKQE